jgi:hypothetical protein
LLRLSLAIREWESHFSGEYGWPRYSEYRHVLLSHGSAFTNADRLRAATEFGQRLIPMVTGAHAGTLPQKKSFLELRGLGFHLWALRKTKGKVMNYG